MLYGTTTTANGEAPWSVSSAHRYTPQGVPGAADINRASPVARVAGVVPSTGETHRTEAPVAHPETVIGTGRVAELKTAHRSGLAPGQRASDRSAAGADISRARTETMVSIGNTRGDTVLPSAAGGKGAA